MVTQEKLYTVDDVWELSHLPENEGKRIELVEGEITIMHPPGGTHGSTTLKVGRPIGDFVEDHQLGEVTVETGYHPPDDPHNLFAPDVAFIRAEHAPVPWPDGYIPVMPDLAIEIVSPNDRAGEIHEKVMRYLRAGTLMVWVFYPASENVVVHTASGSKTIDDTLDGGDILPGFKLAVKDVFS
jgi:Uma2 family endonuclease